MLEDMSTHKSLKLGSTKHQVHLCEGVKGTGEKLFAYSYRTLASVFDVKEATVRQWIHLGKFNPMDLQSVVKFATDMIQDKARVLHQPRCMCGHGEWCGACSSL